MDFLLFCCCFAAVCIGMKTENTNTKAKIRKKKKREKELWKAQKNEPIALSNGGNTPTIYRYDSEQIAKPWRKQRKAIRSPKIKSRLYTIGINVGRENAGRQNIKKKKTKNPNPLYHHLISTTKSTSKYVAF